MPPLSIRLLFVALSLLASAALAEDWTRFRGPNGSGVSRDTGFPTEFGKDQHVVWRATVRPGKSSPVLTARHIFLTGFEDNKLYTQCFDRKTGKLLWERGEERARSPMANALNHPAALTPVTDGENVYVFFKDLGLLSYDAAGKLRWKVPLGPFANSMGLGASPILSGDSIVVVADQLEGSYIAAFDKRDGETRWKVARDESEGWGTPLLYHPPGLPPQILTASRGLFGAHLLASGKRTLSSSGIPATIVGSPILDGDTVYVFGYGADAPSPFSTRLEKYDKNHDGQLTLDEYKDDAFVYSVAKYNGNRDMIVTKEEWDARQLEVMGPNRLMAIRLDRDPAAAPEAALRYRELWKYDKSFTGVIPSPLLYNGVLYVVKNGGILTSFDPQTGKVLKADRIPGAISGYSSSPVAADGKLFLPSEEGKVAVLKAGGDWEVLKVNDLGEPCFATPALAGGHIYLRTASALYRFGVR